MSDSKDVLIDYIKDDIKNTLESGLVEDPNAQIKIIDNYCILLTLTNTNTITQITKEYFKNQRSLSNKIIELEKKINELKKEQQSLMDNYTENAKLMLDAIKDL